jgi:SAM-dependent methyltransferase
MVTFHYSVEHPKTDDPVKIADHLPPRLLYASLYPVSNVRLVLGGLTEENVAFSPRPDVAEQQKNLPFRFHGAVRSAYSIEKWLGAGNSGELVVQVFHPENPCDEIKIPLHRYAYRAMKEAKLEKYAGLLGCPYFRTGLVRDKKNFSCKKCGKVFEHNGNAVNFLTRDLKARFNIVDTENVSDHPLEPVMIQAAESNPDRLFLDIGAGFKYKCYDNVVNVEIVDYPSTDVVAAGGQLPFLDNSFDGVFSSVVLEHVNDPFGCAAEMTRILKPGGELLCSAPFLQPRHGFPNHYYNMTAEGLINLFPGMEIQDLDVPYYLHPMMGLKWILGEYAQGLPQAQQTDFLNMKVVDIIKNFSVFKNVDHPVITQLSQNAKFTIACGTVLRARKPENKTRG